MEIVTATKEDNEFAVIMTDFKLMPALITYLFDELPSNCDGCVSPRTKEKRKDDSRGKGGVKTGGNPGGLEQAKRQMPLEPTIQAM